MRKEQSLQIPPRLEHMLLSLLPVLVLVVPPGASRVEAAEPPLTPLTLERAVALALKRAPELEAAEQELFAARARVDQARAAYWPRLEAEVSYSAHYPKNELPIALPDMTGMPEIGEIDDYHRFKAGLGVGLQLFDLSRGPRVEAAGASLRAEQAQREETEAQLALQVRATFLQALYARDLTRIAGESLKLARAEEKRSRGSLRRSLKAILSSSRST